MASASQALPYFGRAWQVLIDTAAGGHFAIASRVAAGEEPLRITFAINMFMLLAYWTAEVVIYNLNSSTAQQLSQNAPNLGNLWQFNQPIVAGDTVTISAGYQNSVTGAFEPGANQLYVGKVLQPVWMRENVIDFRLTLRCVTGLLEDALNFASFSMAAGATAYDTINQVCSTCSIPVDKIDDQAKQGLQQSTMPRGQAIHGRPFEIIRQFTKQSNLFSWVSPNGLNVRSFDPQKALDAPDYAYGPPNLPGSYTTGGATQQGLVKQTLIGSPQQTPDGVTFQVLLDSNVKIGDVVQLAPGTLVNPYPVQIGALPPVPSRNGMYVVAGVKHVGDVRGRGDDWYTEITGLTMDFFANFLQARTAS